MLIPLFLVGGLTVGSYAFLPSTWQKTRHRMGRRNRWREGTLYLTFDDGPHPEYTPILLDLLASYHIPATFFVVTEFDPENAGGGTSHWVSLCISPQCLSHDTQTDPV